MQEAVVHRPRIHQRSKPHLGDAPQALHVRVGQYGGDARVVDADKPVNRVVEVAVVRVGHRAVRIDWTKRRVKVGLFGQSKK